MPQPALNPLVDRLAPPPIPAVQAWARAYDGAHGPLVDLSQAVPGYEPHPDLMRWLAGAAGDPTLTGYGAIEGDAAFREAYAAHVSALYGARIGAVNIHATAGCNQAFVAAALAVAGPGDAVLTTNPRYFNHETSLRMMGVEPRTVSCRAEDGFVPRPDAVAAALTDGVKALALVSPNNPTGAVYPAGLLAEMLSICRERGVWLILDETYRDFIAGAQRPHELFEQAGWEDNLIQLYSFSKSFCIPGHRLGAITAGRHVVDAVAKVMDNLQICAPRAPQHAVAKGLPALGAWREENRREIERRAVAMRAAFAALPGWEIEALGAYFAFVRHPFEDRSSAAVAAMLARDLGVVTIPGAYFGEGLERFLRIAFANVEGDQIGAVAERLRKVTG